VTEREEVSQQVQDAELDKYLQFGMNAIPANFPGERKRLKIAGVIKYEFVPNPAFMFVLTALKQAEERITELTGQRDYYRQRAEQENAIAEERLQIAQRFEVELASSKQAMAQACIQNLSEMGAALWQERCELYQMIEQLTARVAELEAMQVEEKVAA
jgi:hypothetical protein